MKVLVTGSSKIFQNKDLNAALDAIHQDSPIDTVVVTSDNGYPYLASIWAHDNHVHTRVFVYKGKDDVKRTNQRMMDLEPDIVLAFPGEDATRDILARAANTACTVIEIAG